MYMLRLHPNFIILDLDSFEAIFETSIQTQAQIPDSSFTQTRLNASFIETSFLLNMSFCASSFFIFWYFWSNFT